MPLHSDHPQRAIAAWSELGQRMAQRQSVIQLYMTVVIAVFGFYFSQRPASNEPTASGFDFLQEFFLLSVTMITLISSVLIGVHDRVIVKLKQFLATCEQQAFESSEEGDRYVFYFSDGKFADSHVEGPSKFHGINQYAQKSAFLVTMLACNATAVVLTASEIQRQWLVTICINSLVFSAIFLAFFERVKLEHAPMRSKRKAVPANLDADQDENSSPK